MSRQQFLAELTQYLTFVSSGEREQIIAAFNEKFDQVGPAGEAALIMEMGTPMSIAIALKRKKEAGGLVLREDAAEQAQSVEEETQAQSYEEDVDSDLAAAIGEAVAQETADPLPEEVLREEKVEFPLDAEQSPISESAEADETDVRFEEDEGITETEEVVFAEIPAINSTGAAAQMPPSEPAPKKKLSAGGAIGASLLSIIIIALAAVFAAAGIYGITAMVNFVIAGLRTMSVLTDALLFIGIGFFLGTIGLLITWLSLQLAISGIHNLFCGKSEEDSGFKLGMKRFRRACLITIITLFVLALVALVVAYVMGGDINELFDNSAFNNLVDWYSTNFVAEFIGSLLP